MHILVGLHAVLGEVGALAFLWVFVEMLSPNESRLNRARVVALLGVIFLLGAWFFGGFYYITEYGAAVKPIIKSGPVPWAHSVITETKEHVFLLLPFLAILTLGLLRRYKDEFIQKKNFRIAVLAISGLVVLVAFAMAGMGFLISSGFRAALESKII